MSKEDDKRVTVQGVRFVWSLKKSIENYAKHDGMAFEEALTAYFDPNVCIRQDHGHPDRGHFIGRTIVGNVVVTVYAEKASGEDDVMRIISARIAKGESRRAYQGQFDPKGRNRARSPLPSRPSRPSREGWFSTFARRHGIPRRVKAREALPRTSKLRIAHPEDARRQERGWEIARAGRLRTPGQRLRAIRHQMGLSQTKLASRTGIEQATLSHLEHDQSVLGALRASKLGRALGVHPSVLLWGSR